MDDNTDIVERLRSMYYELSRRQASTPFGERSELDGIPTLLYEAATKIHDLRGNEIERLRRELGQVSDADSWVSKVDAALLDNLLNWCEFNAMDWHRALQRLVNDRARLQNALRLKQEELAACCIDRKEYKWDCFKEEADHNNEYFRTHHK